MKFIKNSHFFTQNNVCAKNVAQELMKEKMFWLKREKKETIITNKKFGERKRILWSMMVVISLQQQNVSVLFCQKFTELRLAH